MDTGFAGTASAREMLRSTGLPLPQTREGSQMLLAETREAWQIEQRLAKQGEYAEAHHVMLPADALEAEEREKALAGKPPTSLFTPEQEQQRRKVGALGDLNEYNRNIQTIEPPLELVKVPATTL